VVPRGGRLALARDFATKRDLGRPSGPVRVERPELPDEAGTLAATWLGHATVLLEVEGRWVLTDPVWSDRASPSQLVGPRRFHPLPLPLTDLPALAAILVSHDHYDHLDTATVDALVRTQDAPFVVPLGVGDHLRRWDVPEHRIVELDWDAAVDVAGLRITSVEARHGSGRGLTTNLTLWSGWAVAGERIRAHFGGDTGYTPDFAEVGERLGPFHLTLLPVGAYDRSRWPDVHLDPAQAVQVHRDLRGQVLLPIHWATFDLAFHEWAAPVEWLRKEAADQGVSLALPPPGRRVDLAAVLDRDTAGDGVSGLPLEPWWEPSV
jgi:L-ascorbate metabolism protein UlaG (beta-lactamase superfamily)